MVDTVCDCTKDVKSVQGCNLVCFTETTIKIYVDGYMCRSGMPVIDRLPTNYDNKTFQHIVLCYIFEWASRFLPFRP